MFAYFDSDFSKVDYHGQQDDVEEGEANKAEFLSQGNFGEMVSSASSAAASTSAQSGDHLFFEDLVRVHS